MDTYSFTTPYWKIALTDDQMYLGRMVIKTLTPKSSLPELSPEEQQDFFKLVARLEQFFKEVIGATMFNYSCLMNHAYRDNEVPHVHFHFRPRYKNPVTLLGYTFSDPNFGEHYFSPSLRTEEKITETPEEVRLFIMNNLKDYFTQYEIF